MPNAPWPPWAMVQKLFRGEQRQYNLGPLTMSQVFRDPVPTFSGVTVTEETALHLTAVWAAVTMIAGSVASLPLHFYRRLASGKEQYTDHPLYWLLHDEPNPEQGTYSFRELLTQHVLLWGNGYAEIQRNESQQAIGLWPITPNRVAIDRPNPRGEVRYRVSNSDGKDTYLRPDQMLHVRGLGFDGVKGYSVIAMHRQSLGLTVAAEKFGAQFFGNGAHASLIAQHPGKMSEPAQKRFKDSWKEAVGGNNQLSMIVMEEGITVEKVTIPPDDAQFLECVVPGTMISMAHGPRRAVETLTVGESVMAWNGAELVSAKIAAVGRPQPKLLVRIRTARGRELTASADHPVLTLRRMRTPGSRMATRVDDWVPMGDLAVGRYVRVALGTLTEGTRSVSGDEDIQFEYDRVVSVEPLGEGDTIGIEIAEHHTHVTNGIITHNTRKMQTEEIARIFNIPPHKIKDLERSTNNNIEQQAIEYVQDTLDPWLQRWEEELTRKLVRPLEKGRQFFEHNVKGRLRGDIAAQTNHYAVMGSHGYYMIDEVRAFEGLNPLPDGLGQRCFIQGAMVPLDRIDEIITAQVKPKPDPTPTDTAEVVDAEPASNASNNGDRAEIIAAIVTALRSTIREAIPAPPPPVDLDAMGEKLRADIVKAFPIPEPEEPDASRHARIVASHRVVVAEAVRRMFRREKERARVAAKNAERMRAWVGEFYERHGESFRGELLPGIGAHCAYLGGDRDAAQVTGELVATWCDESKRQLHALLDRAPADLLAEVDALFTRWEGDRLHTIPDAIMQEELIGHG